MLSMAVLRTYKVPVLAGILSLFSASLVYAAEFVPYPGKREATLVSVEAPDRVRLTFNTDATGFFRTLSFRLPGIVVAADTPQADECERAAAHRALGFTEKFLADADKIYVQDMRMQNSADEEAISPILTDRGSLSSALVKAGLARPDSVDPGTSWCA